MSLLKQNVQIILASTSPVRKKIMKEVGLEFDAISPDFDEDKGKRNNLHLSIEDLAMYLAINKARSISLKNPDAIVIGSDQICELDGKIIDKSQNSEEALSQLKRLTGNIHFQNNAVAALKNGEVIFKKSTKVKLKMQKFSENELTHYVNVDKPWGCAGSYKYESFGKHLFEKIKGDYYSVLGLNIQDLLNFLHKKKYIKIWNL